MRQRQSIQILILYVLTLFLLAHNWSDNIGCHASEVNSTNLTLDTGGDGPEHHSSMRNEIRNQYHQFELAVAHVHNHEADTFLLEQLGQDLNDFSTSVGQVIPLATLYSFCL